MIEIPRLLKKTIDLQLESQKVILLYGTRRVGKTTLIRQVAESYGNNVLFLQGEDIDVSTVLQRRTIANYRRLVGNNKLIVIDEAQAVPDVGKALKLMIDNISGISILATGSSSFELNAVAGEPLVGRQKVFQLFPIAQAELSQTEDMLATTSNLEQRLVYGSYPELWQISEDKDKEAYLRSLINSYLLKDILTYQSVKGADVLYRLLQLLAFQVGSVVSTVELGNALQINRTTVERYLDLLAKVFIIFPLSGYSKNLRKEVTKSKKWFFFDNGIRNGLIHNFNSLRNRDDIGQLWEQYFISERIKFNSYRGFHPQYYFWRTYDGQKVDLIEVNSNQALAAYECKWKTDKIAVPKTFAGAYPNALFRGVTRGNYLDLITEG
jgi:predicted AAA+ superfamily ATPase